MIGDENNNGMRRLMDSMPSYIGHCVPFMKYVTPIPTVQSEYYKRCMFAQYDQYMNPDSTSNDTCIHYHACFIYSGLIKSTDKVHSNLLYSSARDDLTSLLWLTSEEQDQ